MLKAAAKMLLKSLNHYYLSFDSLSTLILGGPSATVVAHVSLIRSQGATQNLYLNDKKYETIHCWELRLHMV